MRLELNEGAGHFSISNCLKGRQATRICSKRLVR
jgi:hypothetical protein